METKQTYNAFKKLFYQALWLKKYVVIQSQGEVFYNYAGVGNDFSVILNQNKLKNIKNTKKSFII